MYDKFPIRIRNYYLRVFWNNKRADSHVEDWRVISYTVALFQESKDEGEGTENCPHHIEIFESEPWAPYTVVLRIKCFNKTISTS